MGESSTFNTFLAKQQQNSSTSLLQLIQRSQDPSETEAEIILEIKKTMDMTHRKNQINALDRRTQTTIFRLCTGHGGLRKHLKRLGLADSAHCE